MTAPAVGAAAVVLALGVGGCGGDDEKNAGRTVGATAATGPSGGVPPRTRGVPGRQQAEAEADRELRERGRHDRRREPRGQKDLRDHPDRPDASGDDVRIPIILRGGDLSVPGRSADGRTIASYITDPGKPVTLTLLGEHDGVLVVDGPGKTQRIDLKDERSVRLKALGAGDQYLVSLAAGRSRIKITAR